MGAEHAPGRVGAGVGGEGADEDVDQQRRAVVGQVAEQHRVDQRQADPDRAEDGHAHRDDDPLAGTRRAAKKKSSGKDAVATRSTLKAVPK